MLEACFSSAGTMRLWRKVISFQRPGFKSSIRKRNAQRKRAIDDVLADLAAGRPMDRLIVGDVGFGKTEVALRAVAAALFVIARLRIACREHGIARVEGGPKGLAFTVRDDSNPGAVASLLDDFPEAGMNRRQIIPRREAPAGVERLKLAESFVSAVWG